MDLDRGAFLRLGASGAAAVVATALPAAAALAAPPPAAPIGDDVGFLAFGVVAERTALACYRRALATPRLFSAADRRALDHAKAAKRTHVARLNAALGADAVGSGDYEVELPKAAFGSRARALELGASLEELLVGVYLSGAAWAADPGTRLLASRLLTVDGQILGDLRRLAGKPAVGGLPAPLGTEEAGATLDKLITVPGSPGGG